MNANLFTYIIKRLLLAIVTIFLIIAITFFVMYAIPGGPFLSEKSSSPAVQKMLEAKYGLDKPLLQRFFIYIGDLLKGDFGPSIKNRGQNVIDIILNGFSVSAKLGAIAALLAIVVGIVLGCIVAINRGNALDKTIMVFSTASVAMPSFVIATFLMLIFCVHWQIFPANGETNAGLVLPIIALSLYPMSYITRLTRSSMLDVLGQDYIRTARAKGVSQSKVIFKHALKNSLIPVITYIGPMFAYILTGSMVVENIFAVPGLGSKFVSSITNRDYPMIMGTTIFLATLIVVMTFISDLLYKIVDPRIELK